MSDVVCLDAGVWIKAIAAEDLSDEAAAVLTDAVERAELVSPAFCWTEVGSVLRKKVRARVLTAGEAEDAWADFQAMPVKFIDTPRIRSRAWELAEQLRQATLYDAAYLACTELADGSSRTFWTADDALIRALGDDRPPYVRHLRDLPAPGGSHRGS